MAEDAPVFAELANLIGSLNIDLEKHSRPQRTKVKSIICIFVVV